MNGLFELLTKQEKKTLRLIAAAAAFCFLAFLIFSMGEWKRSDRSRRSLAALKTEFEKARGEWEKTRLEWLRWEEARQDLKELEAKGFYADVAGMNDLRLDLERIFNEAGLHITQIGYDYKDLEKEKIKKVTASFVFKGSYPSLKKFLAVIEQFPRFLTIERIDFMNTGSETGALELKLELAGYYEI